MSDSRTPVEKDLEALAAATAPGAVKPVYEQIEEEIALNDALQLAKKVAAGAAALQAEINAAGFGPPGTRPTARRHPDTAGGTLVVTLTHRQAAAVLKVIALYDNVQRCQQEHLDGVALFSVSRKINRELDMKKGGAGNG